LVTNPDSPDREAQITAARAEIDQIDMQILAAIGRRMALADVVAAAKDAAESPLRPAREVQLLRRLIEKPPPGMEREVVLLIWRALIGANLRRQRPLEVVIAGGLDAVRQFDAARAHFGPTIKISREPDVRTALIKIAESRDIAGMVPWPGAAGPGAWWGMMSESRFHGVMVGAALPMMAQEPEFALVASGLRLAPAGEDRTLLVGFDQRFRLTRALSEAGLTGRETARGANHAVLVTVDGFLAANDPRRDALAIAGLDGVRVVGTFSQL
jgi:chorismate mutase